MDDLAAHGERREELRALQRLGLVRQCLQAAVQAACQTSGLDGRGQIATRRSSRKVRARSRRARSSGESGGSSRNESGAIMQPATIASYEL